MKTNDRNRDDRSSKHGGNNAAVLPTADSPKASPQAAPLHGGSDTSDQRDLAGKGKEAPGSKGHQAPSTGKTPGEKPSNPAVKR